MDQAVISFLVFLLAASAAEECNPQDYKINIPNLYNPTLFDTGITDDARAYCSGYVAVPDGSWGRVTKWDPGYNEKTQMFNLKPATWEYDKSNWGLYQPASGGCAQSSALLNGFLGVVGCPCFVHGGSTSMAGSCGCAMKYDRHQGYCFRGTTPCNLCGRDTTSGLFTFRFACGCISCIQYHEAAKGWDSAENRQLLGWPSDARCGDATNPRWYCGPGFCQTCPVGYYCPPSSLVKLPCERGYYQDTAGASVCKPCRCQPGYFVKDDQEAALCDSKTGVPVEHCQRCDQCTDAGTSQQCSGIRDTSYGYWVEKDHQGRRKCKKCTLCAGHAYARFPAGLDNFCVTDNTTAGACVEQYSEERCMPGPTNSCPSVLGPMKWRAGSRRVQGEQYTPGSKGNANLGFLPYYEACSALPQGWRWRATPINDATDCEQRECARGYYATLAHDQATVSKCTPCQPGSSGGGGVVTECVCDLGRASFNLMKSKFPEAYMPTAQTAIDCVDCMRDVYFFNGNAKYQEAVACRNGSVTRASAAQYVFPGNGSIGNCPSVALQNRTGCTTCPPGTYTTRDSACAPCREGEYQATAGQTSCKTKRTRCDAGRMMVSDSASKADRLKDYACEPCLTECPSNQITVRSPNMSSDVATCDGNGKSFYACYNGWGDGTGPHAPPGYRLRYTGEGSATMHSCDAPPSHATWVGFQVENAAGAECYFACIHGVNASARGIYNAALDAHVRRYRRELIPFLVKPTQPAATVTATVMLDSVWRYEPLSAEMPPDLLSWTTPLRWDVAKNVADASANTFLFIPDIAGSAVCMSAATSYTIPCPTGFTANPLDYYRDDVEGCALIARNSLLKISRKDMVSYAAVSGAMQCITDTPSALSTFQNRNRQCGAPILNARFAAANRAALYEKGTNGPWGQRLYLFSKLLTPNFWIDNPETGSPSYNPYIPTIAATKCGGDAFEWSSDSMADANGKRQSHKACVPCSIGPLICGLLTPPQFFRGCGFANATAACIECQVAYVDGAALIDMNSDAYAEWLTLRATMDAQNFDAWEKVQCRYYCPAGHTSNLDPNLYKTRPCLPCAAVMRGLCRGVNGQAFVEGASTTCGSTSNIAPYMPRCRACNASDYDALYDFDTNASVVANGHISCIGRCKPSIYHSVQTSSNVRLPPDSMVAIGSIECVQCNTLQTAACNGKCGEGFYRIGTADCRKCSTDACPLGYYRERCPATADATCIQCPQSPPEGAMISNATLNFTMKAVHSLHPHECPLRCANNYAWINLTSGLSPWGQSHVFDPAVFACVSCSTLSQNSAPLYSFWKHACVSTPTAIPATDTAALRSMQSVAGGCCRCQLHHDVVSSSTSLCELRAGFTTMSQPVTATVYIRLSIPPPEIFDINSLTARRLLSAGQNDVISVTVVRQPVLYNMDYFAVCDNEASVEEKRKCVATRGKSWELSKSLTATRRVTATRSSTAACAAGTYKPGRGSESPCYACSEGSSTTGPYYEGATACVCIPGYVASGDVCTPCDVGTYRSPNTPDICVACPPLSETAAPGSAYCYCIDGAYNSYDGECVMCEPGFYCESGTRHQCHQNSASASGAKSREECVCGPDYYYGPSSKECIFKGSTRTSAGDCIAGWRRTASGGCTSGCNPGTFLLSAGVCVPCPPGTFSSTGDMVGQCMPCPTNKNNGSTTCEPATAECVVGEYYDFSSCRPCPSGTVSPPNSIGIGSCRCPPGFFIVAPVCVPCPKGMFSSTISSTCSKCPPNFTTDTPGATSLLACRRNYRSSS